MPFADHDDMAKAFSSDQANYPLGILFCHGERGATYSVPTSRAAVGPTSNRNHS
jgi:hypothetical protein